MSLTELDPPRFVGTAENHEPAANRMVEVAVILVAILGRLPALGAWWNLDDWGLLGQAAGLIEADAATGFPARWLSQHLYWHLAYPVFGLAADPYSWTRLLLHAGSAWLVIRIARRAGLGNWPRLIAGILFAASPLAFTPLYWAAGIQELLAAFFALLAVERWLAGGRGNLAWAVAMAVLSLLSKESGLGLPLLFLAFLWAGVGVKLEDKAYAWALTLLLFVAAVIEGTLVAGHFASGPQDPYALGSVKNLILNLGVFGWWLLSPGPILASSIHWPMAAAGSLFFLGWGLWGIQQQRQGRLLPLLSLLAALLVISPALPLENQLHPYLAYLALAPMGLALGSLAPDRPRLPLPLLAGVALVAALWSFWSMDQRLSQRDTLGLPADPVVRATSLSWQLSRSMEQIPLERGQDEPPALTLLQIPSTNQTAEMAAQLGDRWVAGTQLYATLGGTKGPQLILQHNGIEDVRVSWVNALFTNPSQAVVLCAAGTEFKHWGNTANAAFYAALADVGMGRFERARRHLIRGADLQRVPGQAENAASFFYDPDQMFVPMSQVLARKEEFIDWTLSLMGEDHSPQEIGGLQDVFLQLLVAGTGQSLEELTRGSTLINNR